MSIKLKLLIYAVLIVVATVCGRKFFALYKGMDYSDRKARKFDSLAAPTQDPTPLAIVGSPTNPVPIGTNPPILPTNVAAGGTNAGAPGAASQMPVTNLTVSNPMVVTTTNAASPGTNSFATAVVGSTNTTNAGSAATVPAPPATPLVSSPAPKPAVPQRTSYGHLMGYLGGLLASVIILGLMLARDFSKLVGHETLEFLFNDQGKGIKNPEYDQIEQVWQDGDHLEAIRLMRDYYQRNPREVYVALRIAEIYEKDLGNFLAAALEYEEILKKKLPAERWGWAAVHLCNIYYKLRREEEATALLNRIVNEYGRTAAAKKARKRLGLPEPTEEAAVEGPGEESLTEEAPAPEPPAPAAPEPPKSNLPPGFRPKKR